MDQSRPSLNFCDLPPWAIQSLSYNLDPRPLRIQGVRRTHHRLFHRLDASDAWDERARIYQDYMDVAFHLHQWREESLPSGQLSLKNSYLRFLRGWLFDSNSIEGAVLKGWVESRLGIPPTFHRGPISDVHDESYLRYLADRMNGSARTHAILSQLDLLYEFVQYELDRRHSASRHLTLYRGVHDFSEHEILERIDRKRVVLRLNNLNSFTRDFERAWEFGTKVLEARVPLPKIFFDGSFLHAGILKGEEEVLVVGGPFEVAVRIY